MTQSRCYTRELDAENSRQSELQLRPETQPVGGVPGCRTLLGGVPGFRTPLGGVPGCRTHLGEYRAAVSSWGSTELLYPVGGVPDCRPQSGVPIFTFINADTYGD